MNQIILCAIAIILLIGVMAIKEVAKAIREQTQYFKEDNEEDDYDDGDEWKRLLKN